MRLILGDCLEALAGMAEASIDAVVTDPPYGIGFMGKEWDSFSPARVAKLATSRSRKGTRRFGDAYPSKAGKTAQGGGVAVQYDESAAGNRRYQEAFTLWARECLRVMRPGAHLVAFGGPRTFHRLACALEDAGLEVRDCFSWLYGSGYPKSKKVGGGWGTGLKPAWEPVLLARRRISEDNVADNRERHGTGGIHVEACRIPGAAGDGQWGSSNAGANPARTFQRPRPGVESYRTERHPSGRWPANVLLDPEAARMLDEQSGELRSGFMAAGTRRTTDVGTHDTHGDAGGASRFFYTAKASRREREEGLAGRARKAKLWSKGEQSPGTFQREGTDRTSTNHHPTVKPVSLMRWLVRLVAPAGGTILDPFMGSGTTGIACRLEGFDFVGVEREAEYLEIARRRIANAASYALVAETEEQPALFRQAPLPIE